MGKAETLATIWEIPDHLWEQIHPVILELDRPKATGRQRVAPDGCWTASFSDAQRLPVEPPAEGIGG